MKTFSLLFFLVAFPAYAQSEAPSEITGTVHVMDGDIIHVNNASGTTPVRLQGIAAPGLQEDGGRQAAAFLSQYAENKAVRCVMSGTKIQDLEAGICYVGGKDIAAEVVRAGLARDCPAFSGGRYWGIERPEAQKLLLPDYCQ